LADFLKAQKDPNTMILEGFKTLWSPIGRSSKEKIHIEILKLNDTVDQMDLIDIHHVFHSPAEQYTFFSGESRAFAKINHVIGQKSNS
jgi:hypothetical protein